MKNIKPEGKPEGKQEEIEKDIEFIMGNLLRIGVIISASFVLIGGILYLWQHGGSLSRYSVFRGEPSDLRNLIQIYSEAFSFNSLGLIQLGIILLIATPVARVLFSVIAFLYEKDYLYVVFTLIVLSVLLYSLSAGF
jgi:uncharacterized membrane protein